MFTKEDYLAAVVGHEKPQHLPSAMSGMVVMAGGSLETFENGPFRGGPDGFGVVWEASRSAGGQAVPASGHIVLDDITDWEDVVKFPDLDAYDWKGQAEIQLSGADRDRQLVEYGAWNAQFLRVTHLMGFMDGLCAFAEEPEACRSLIEAITDYKIRLAERVAHYFKPDFFTSYDDVATQQSLFLSPQTYRDLIKPSHKRLNDAVKAYGMMPIMHTCGHCEPLIPDFIDEGAVAWSSAQPVNDIAGILQKYGKQIAVIGGYDSNGPAGREDAPDAVIEEEVKRCIDSYPPYGSYVFMGFRVMSGTEPDLFFKGLLPINQAFDKLTRDM